MSFAVESCKTKATRTLYNDVKIADSSLTIVTPYGSVDFSGSLALRPTTDPCGSCEGVLVLFFIEGALNGQYLVNGRSIIPLREISLQERDYRVDYFMGKDLYWAAAQFAGGCASCGCDGCSKIWSVSSATVTWDSLVESEKEIPGHEAIIPMAFRLAGNQVADVCDDTIRFLSFNDDIKI
jgi:hypothetical protein